jgi:hypothetical protein
MTAPGVALSARMAQGGQLKAVERLGVGVSDLLLILATGKRF